MKTALVKKLKNSSGFTLIELMVVIAIIAILVTIGYSIFNNAQKSGRDGKRRADVDAIVKALEINKPLDSGYIDLSDTQFTSGGIPVDASDTNYCVSLNTVDTTPPSAPTAWTATQGCPTDVTWTWIEVTSSVDFDSESSPALSWTICTRLEATSEIFCRSNAQ